ncbi:hypothetical protein P43SY_000613 [Pythium insidiosum]|uniref:Histidine acid phosphatase n=1 Tax=Pythium insidiosum TaxID=114742 RepID=A0AAD5Q6S4_PYTIN|nr:hypothetical protein P43SY_000613 [Pythium insidiosum]
MRVPPADDENALQLVHLMVMFRHGDRSPISRRVGRSVSMGADELQFWVSRLPSLEEIQRLNHGTRVVLAPPNAAPPALDEESLDARRPPSPRHGGKWPCGQLTTKGVREMTAKGRRLRERYAAFMDAIERPEDDVHLELEVADASRIAIHVDDSNSLGPSHSLELFQDLDTMLAEDIRLHAPKGLRETARRVRDIIGIERGRLIPWSSLREVLVCRREHGLPMPQGVNQELFDRVHDLDGWLWHTLYSKRDFCVGSFRRGVQRFYDALSGIAQNEVKHKLTLFSAHDNSLVALMRALQLRVDPAIPHYGAMLTFEIYRHPLTAEMFICARYEDQAVTFQGHEHSAVCPISHVERLTNDFLSHQRSGQQ